jgi:guanyl-specific ribonuclease Sa
MTDRLRRTANPAAAPEQVAPARVSGSAGALLALQRKAGNRATAALLSQQVNRKVAKSTVAGEGPIAEIPNSALSKDDGAIVSKAVTAIKADAECPWPRMRKWGAYHGNFEGKLPGKKGAGGYEEYYLPKFISTNSPESPLGRLVVGGGKVFHTADHYGSFTHYGSL